MFFNKAQKPLKNKKVHVLFESLIGQPQVVEGTAVSIYSETKVEKLQTVYRISVPDTS